VIHGLIVCVLCVFGCVWDREVAVVG
jgi:hypothetical protein